VLSTTPDSAITTAGTPVTIDVLANDTGTGLVITSFSNPANGSLVYNSGDKSFTYTPAAGFVGDDAFSYMVRDAEGAPATAEVTISVVASGGATIATDDYVEVVADSGVIVPVLANDMAAGGGQLQIIAVSNPGHGVVNVLPDQSIRYVPQTGFVGIDSFAYTVLDAQGATATATVTVEVVTGNSAPIAVADTFDVVADTTTVLAVLANDSDPNGGPLQIVGFTMPSHGSLAFNAADKTFAYTPDAGYEGQDQFTYTIRDNRGASVSAAVTLSVARLVASPTAVDDQVTTEAGVPVIIDVLANDTLPAGQNVGIIAVSLPFRGKLDFNPDKTITYTPNIDFVGTDDFTYTIGNGQGGTAKATVTIAVTAAQPNEWQPTLSPELTTTIDALEAAAGGYIFVPQVGGMRTINANRDAVGNGDSVGFWSDVLSARGLTADGDGRPVWNDGEGAVSFVQPAAARGRALFFPEDITATKWHLLLCIKSTDNEKFLSQTIFQIPVLRLLANWQGDYNLDVQVISGGINFHRVEAGPINDYTLVELRRDGDTLQTRTNGQNWTTHSIIGWSSFAAADGDPNASMVGRSSYTDSSYPDFVSWSGHINGVVMALDAWLEDDANEAARRVVTAGKTLADLDPIEATAPLPPPSSSDEPGSTGTATATVGTYSQLASAIEAAGPGTIIQLADGTYSGSRIVVSASGTAENPIVIRAANLLQANVPNGFALEGSHVVVRGLTFRTGAALNLPILLGGQFNQVWRCRFPFIGGDSVRFVNGNGGRLMYCEFYSLEPDNHYQPSCEVVRGNWNSSTVHTDLEIGYCFFHDMPAKPPGESYGFRVRMALSQGGFGGGGRRFNETNAYIHHNLLQDTGSCRLAIYNSGNRLDFNTVTGQSVSGSPVSVDFNQRFGRNNVWRGCWAEGTKDGFLLHSGPNIFNGCKIVNGGTAQVFAGNIEATEPTSDAYPRSENCRFTGCDFPMIVGRVWTTSPPMNLPARNTRIEGHTGSVSLNGSSQTGTVQTGDLTEAVVTPIKITPAMVGPLAGL